MKRNRCFVVILVALIVSVLGVSCELGNDTVGKQYTTPTAKGRISLPEDSTCSYSDVWVKVLETGREYKVNSDGTWVVPDLEEGKEYTLSFQNRPFSNINRGFDLDDLDDLDADDIAELTKVLDKLLARVVDKIIGSKGPGHDCGDVLLKKTAAVKGKVVYPDASKKPQGIMVYIPGTTYSAMTDAEGRFTLKGLPEGSYTLAATAPGYNNYSEKYFNVHIEGNKASIIKLKNTIVLIPDTGAINGTVAIKGEVLDENIWKQINVSLFSETKEDRQYTIAMSGNHFSKDRIEPDTYRLEVSLAGYHTAVVEHISVVAPNTTAIEEVIRLNPVGFSVSGKVVLKDGKDPAGASILATREDDSIRYSAIADSNGMFRFDDVLPGTYKLEISMAGYASIVDAKIRVEDADIAVGNFELLTSDGIIRGCIEKDDGGTLKDIPVKIINADTHATRLTVTDESGVYAFEKCDAGKYELSISVAGYEELSITDINVVAGSEITENRTLINTTGSISGNLSFNDGRNPAGFSIAFIGPDNKQYETIVEADGKFTLFRCPEGEYTALIQKDGYLDSNYRFSVVRNIATPLDIVLQKLEGAIFGTITLESGTPVVNQEVKLTDNDSRKTYFAYTDKYGYYVFNDCIPGTYTLSVTAKGYLPIENTNIVVKSNEPTEANRILVSNMGSIVGTFKFTDRRDATGLSIIFLNESNEQHIGVVDGLGKFSIDCAPGVYRVLIQQSGYEDFSATVRVEAKRKTPIDIRMRKNSGSISGTVVLEDNAAPNNIEIKLIDNVSNEIIISSPNDSGVYSFPDCSFSTYTLEFSLKGYAPVRIEKINIINDHDIVINKILQRNTGSIIGHIVFVDGKNPAGLIVTFTDEAKNQYVGVSNASGDFIIEDCPFGIYSISFHVDGYQDIESFVQVSKNKPAEIILDMQTSFGSVTGKCTESGNPIDGVKITIIPVGGGVGKTEFSRPNGFYNIEVPAGNYDLVFSKDGYGPVEIKNIEIIAGRAIEQHASLVSAKAKLTGSVVLTGDTVSEALYNKIVVKVINETDSTINFVLPVVDHVFTAHDMVEGTYRVEVSLDDFGSVTLTGIKVVAGQLNVISSPIELVSRKFGKFTWSEFGEGVEITGGSDLNGEVIIPASIYGKPVLKIGNHAFAGTGITKINFPESLTHIGIAAFQNCWLYDIELPKNLVSIGQSAFDGCRFNYPIYIRNTIEYVGNSAFTSDWEHCIYVYADVDRSGWEPHAITGDYVYYDYDPISRFSWVRNNTGITIKAVNVLPSEPIFIPETLYGSPVTRIEDGAVYGFNGCHPITIPASVEYVGKIDFAIYAFVARGADMSKWNPEWSGSKTVYDGYDPQRHFVWSDDGTQVTFEKAHYFWTGEIPAEIDGMPVTRIADMACANHDETSTEVHYKADVITLPSTIEYVGSYAFCGYSGVINIPKELDTSKWNKDWNSGGSATIKRI